MTGVVLHPVVYNWFIIDKPGSTELKAATTDKIIDLDPASAKTLRVEVNHAGTITAAEARLDLSRFAPTPATTPPVTQPATPVVTAAATPAPGGGGGGSSVPLALAGGVLVLGLAGAGGAFYWRRRNRQMVPQELRTPWRPRPEDPGAVFVGTGPLSGKRRALPARRGPGNRGLYRRLHDLPA